MYVASDPRSKLAKAESEEKPDAAPVSAAGYFMFDDSQPCDQNGDVRTWYAEAQNFVATYAVQPAGSRIVRERQARRCFMERFGNPGRRIFRGRGAGRAECDFVRGRRAGDLLLHPKGRRYRRALRGAATGP